MFINNLLTLMQLFRLVFSITNFTLYYSWNKICLNTVTKPVTVDGPNLFLYAIQ